MTPRPRTLRSLLPLPIPALAAIASEVAGQLADLHAAGLVHGALSADAIFVEDGAVRLAHRSHDTAATDADDIAALGRVVTNALVAAGTSAAGEAARRLAGLAADARGAALPSAHTSAAVLAAAFLAAVDGAHVPSDTELSAPLGAAVPAGGLRRALVLAGWVALPAIAVVAVLRFDAGLAAPPLLDGWDAMAAWLERHDAEFAFASVLRLVVLVLGSYLALTTAIGVTLRLAAGTDGAVSRVADALLLPPVRRLVHALVGAGLAAGAFTVGAAGATEPSPPAVMRQVPDDGDIVMERLGPPATATAGASAATSEEAPWRGAEREWTAAPGDHLWGIAESVLAEAWQRPPTDDEIDGYWRRLVADNRDRLADADVPDLIFPGQVFRVPTPPQPSTHA